MMSAKRTITQIAGCPAERAKELAAHVAEIMLWDLDGPQVEAVVRDLNGSKTGKGTERTGDGRAVAVRDAALPFLLRALIESEESSACQARAAVMDAIGRYWGPPSSARLLEYGGGVGSNSLEFCGAFRHIAYAEHNNVMKEFARRRFQQLRTPVVCIASTEAYSACFDVVVSLHGVREGREGTVQPDVMVQEMVRLTKPGGLVLVAEGGGQLETLDALMHGCGCRKLEQVDGGMVTYVKGPTVTVIVPVYNALEHTSELLESIRTTHPGYPMRWMFVNDGSPDPAIALLLNGFKAEAPEIRLVENRHGNRGFVQTCNAAIEATGADDVILLNSDTQVYDGWVRKLVEAAYQASDIGTVTPLSNNASAFSVVQGASPSNSVNATLSGAERSLIDIPSGVGFCLYIKREVVDKVGLFDPIFGRGYGEETDLCQRASRAGYRHVLTPNIFIYHAGNASMAAAGVIELGQETVAEHARIISERYPDFDEQVADFMAGGIVERLSADIAGRYVTSVSAKRPSLALVTHTDIFREFIGGTEYHLRDLMRELEADYVFYVLCPTERGIGIAGVADGVRAQVEWTSDDYDALFEDLRPGLVHIHHLRGYPSAFVDALTHWRGTKVFSIHDFNGLCPSYTLLNDSGRFCGVPAQEECGSCAERLFGTGFTEIASRRALHQRLVDAVDLVLAPSQSALDIFRHGVRVPEERGRVVEHPIPQRAYHITPRRLPVVTPAQVSVLGASHEGSPAEGTLTVGFIGYNAMHKGGRLVQSIVARCRDNRMRFVAIGEIADGVLDSSRVRSTGLYRRENVVDLIEQSGIDVIVLTSPWPETYSYTLSEAWLAGVPVIVGPLGALSERVQASGGGLVTANYDADTFVEALRQLDGDREQLSRLKARARAVTLPCDFSEHRTLYSELEGKPLPTRMFSGVVAQRTVSANVPPPVAPQPPVIMTLVQVRKLLVPIGSRRERLYFKLHNLVTPYYTDGRVH